MMLRIVLKEAWHRRTTSLLTILAVALAVAVVVVFRTMAIAGENETRLIQRDLGLNIVILPASMSLDRYWTLGYSDRTLPAAYLERLSNQQVANRLVPLLRRPVAIDGTEAMLTGIGAEVFKGNQKKKPVYGMEVQPGTVVLGAEVADRIETQRDAEIELLGESFRVAHVLAGSGSEEDVRVYGNLADVQRLLHLEGRLGEIQALECHCADDVDDPFAVLTAQLGPLLPETQIVRREQLAEGRRQQRLLAERFAAMATPLFVLLCGALVATLAAVNVRERRSELGILQALGYRGRAIAGVFLSRAVLLGIVGAAVGLVLAALLVGTVGPAVFKVAPQAVTMEPTWIVGSLFVAPLFAAAAALLPAMHAATLDPAETLRDG